MLLALTDMPPSHLPTTLQFSFSVLVSVEPVHHSWATTREKPSASVYSRVVGLSATSQVQATVVWGSLDHMVPGALPAGPTITMLLSGSTTAHWQLGTKLTRWLMCMSADGVGEKGRCALALVPPRVKLNSGKVGLRVGYS